MHHIVRNSDIENKDEILARFSNLAKQDAEEKAQTIQQIMSIASQQGISQDLITAGISEIIASQEQTPALDELLNTIEQNFEMQMQQQEQQMMAQQQAQADALGNSGVNASPDAINAAQQIMNGEINPQDVVM